MFSITVLKQKQMFEQIPRKSNNASKNSLSLWFVLNNVLVLKIGHKCVVGKSLLFIFSAVHPVIGVLYKMFSCYFHSGFL